MIYLDNAATTWPKPPSVIETMHQFMQNSAFSPGRGTHQGALDAAAQILRTRQALARLFDIKEPNRIVFTSNATMGLNMALQGLLEAGDHVITTSMEHNAVWRPLKHLEHYGIELSVVNCNQDGQLEPNQILNAIKKNTKLIATVHASNVIGTILPIREIGKIAKTSGIKYLVDASQTAGVIPINVQDMCIDLLAFPGHKGLYGPQGTGALFVNQDTNLKPIIQGGTGTSSELDFQPTDFPYILESGTLNAVGIAGLGAGIEYVIDKGTEIYQHEIELCKLFIDQANKNLNSIQIYGTTDWPHKVPVVSFNIGNHEPSEIGYLLDKLYHIAVRAGLHCAPQAHKTIGTLNRGGTIRISPSIFNTPVEIMALVNALQELEQELK